MLLQGHKIRFTALLIMVGVLTCVLYAKTGITAPAKPLNEVRMSVDPTVLPPVMPPSDDDLPPEPMVSDEAPQDEVELPEIENPTPLPKRPGKVVEEKVEPVIPVVVDTGEPTPAPKAAAKPTPKPTPKAEAKPAPKVTPAQIITPTPPGVGKGTVTKVAMDSKANSFTMTVYCTRPVGDTSYINLRNPRRLVVDLREPWFLKAGNRIKVKGGVVKQIVTGAHPDRLRLVIYFNRDIKGNITPQFVRTGNKLIVSANLPN